MSGPPCLNTNKEELQEAMDREVILMRNLLTSLRGEYNAIKIHDTSMLDLVMEERINLFSSFEHWREKVISLAIKLAAHARIAIDSPSTLRHSEALDLLYKCLEPDDFELLSVREKIIALIDEIHHQNDINAALMREGAPPQLLQRIQVQNKEKGKIKSVVTVIER